MNLPKLTDKLDIITSLPDKPIQSASDLKRSFDEASNKIKDYINDLLIPDISSEVNQEITNSKTSIMKEIQETLDDLKENINNQLEEFKNNIQGNLDSLNGSIGKKLDDNDFEVTTHTYSVSVNAFTVSNPTRTITKNGYFPIAVAGCGMTNREIQHNGTQFATRGIGSCNIKSYYYNIATTTQTGTETIQILWVRAK